VSESEGEREIREYTERFEHILKWMEEVYSQKKVPTLEALCRCFGLTPAEALTCLAEFHRRYPIAFPITFSVASKNPTAFWGFTSPLFTTPSEKVKRLAPPGIPSRPYRRLGTILFIIGMMLVLASLVLMAYYGGVP